MADDPNEITLQAYNAEYETYVETCPPIPTGFVLQCVERFLENVSPKGRILEIGSGPGRDLRFMKSQGYKVTPTDATEGFVKNLISQGHPALLLNVLKNRIYGVFDAAYASAVFHHFTDDQAKIAFANIANALTIGGVVGILTRYGDEQRWEIKRLTKPRYYHFWTPSDLEKLVKQFGFGLLHVSVFQSDTIPKFQIEPDPWTFIIARKEQANE